MTLSRRTANYIMKSDIREKKDSYILEIDLPGFQKDDIQAYVENGFLIVTAVLDSEREKEKHHGRYIRRERYTGAYERRFYIGSEVSQEAIRAVYKHGILKVTIPKTDGIPDSGKGTISIV